MVINKIAYGLLGASVIGSAVAVGRKIADKIKYERDMRDWERVSYPESEEYDEDERLINELEEINRDLLSWFNKENTN